MEISNSFLVLIPIVVGVVEAIKRGVGMSTRFAPLMSLVLGVAGVWTLSAFTSVNIIQGLIVGLSACGLWACSKKTIQG